MFRYKSQNLLTFLNHKLRGKINWSKSNWSRRDQSKNWSKLFSRIFENSLTKNWGVGSANPSDILGRVRLG